MPGNIPNRRFVEALTGEVLQLYLLKPNLLDDANAMFLQLSTAL